MATENEIMAKLSTLKDIADELAAGIAGPSGTEAGGAAAMKAARRRFDCGAYTCHGHFTCSNFGCSDAFALSD